MSGTAGMDPVSDRAFDGSGRLDDSGRLDNSGRLDTASAGPVAAARVDVIIPTRNRAQLTLETVAAVQAQTFTDWRLLVVDDASTDDTAERIGALAAADRRITVLRRSNQGGANPARQTGLDESTAPLVAICDSDDLWEPDKLALQVEAWDRAAGTGTGAAGRSQVGPVLCWHDALDVHGHRRGAVQRRRPSRRWHPFTAFNTSTPLMSRELLDQVGGFAPVSPYPFATTDHLDLFLRLTRTRSAVVVPSLLVHCRHHPGPRNSDAECTPAAAEEAADLLQMMGNEVADRPRTSAWLHAAVAGRFLEVGDHRQARPLAINALRLAGPTGGTAIVAHYGPWVLRRLVQQRLEARGG